MASAGRYIERAEANESLNKALARQLEALGLEKQSQMDRDTARILNLVQQRDLLKAELDGLKEQ